VEVYEDGRVKLQWETYTMEQWKKVALLTVCHATEMKALKESFKVTPTATAAELTNLQTA